MHFWRLWGSVGRWRFCCFCHPSRLPSRTASGRRTHALSFRSRCPNASRGGGNDRIVQREPAQRRSFGNKQSMTRGRVAPTAARAATRQKALLKRGGDDSLEKINRRFFGVSWNYASSDPLQPAWLIMHAMTDVAQPGGSRSIYSCTLRSREVLDSGCTISSSLSVSKIPASRRTSLPPPPSSRPDGRQTELRPLLRTSQRPQLRRHPSQNQRPTRGRHPASHHRGFSPGASAAQGGEDVQSPRAGGAAAA